MYVFIYSSLSLSLSLSLYLSYLELGGEVGRESVVVQTGA